MSKLTLSAKEIALLMAAAKHQTTPVQTDFALVAAELGYKSAKVARDSYYQVKKKMTAAVTPGGGISKDAVTKKGAALKNAGGGKTSTKREVKSKKKAEPVEDTEAEDGEDYVVVKGEDLMDEEE